ncbi:thermonuclease family protein [Methylobacterium sp. J-076]|uniref:thermonuclease family protein n=1 Tax=Methylobacterium sp. J-076 TaxID=2836655 RepID=UPI001FBA5092|nr:pentapeptide repeat-containing protein [Methylobacterium sp. J-076]MCJ2014140.1 pentapeptide repeat-containing protein [Methylobacterium sp. J-076]
MGGSLRYAPWLLLGLGLPASGAPVPHPDCTPAPARTETLDGLGLRGEMRFASGGRAVLDSLRWPEDDAPARDRLARWAGQRLVVVPLGSPDRWGRERVAAEAEAGGDFEGDLAGDLVGAGLAHADPGEAEALCRPALRLVEAMARRRRLGLWRDGPLAAEDGAALRGLAGRYAVVKGVVRHVGERSARTYLDFGPRGGDGLTVTVTKRTWRTMAAHGLTADSLPGRRVRVRGVVEVWRGPVIAAATADAVEMLDEGAPVAQDARGQDDSEVRR